MTEAIGHQRSAVSNGRETGAFGAVEKGGIAAEALAEGDMPIATGVSPWEKRRDPLPSAPAGGGTSPCVARCGGSIISHSPPGFHGLTPVATVLPSRIRGIVVWLTAFAPHNDAETPLLAHVAAYC